MITRDIPNPGRYDLKDPAQRAAYQEEWLDLKASEGFRVRETHEKGADGWPTLSGLLSAQDQFVHNVSIHLRQATDAAGRDTEAGRAVSDLWHSIVANSLEVRNTLKHYAELEPQCDTCTDNAERGER